MRRYVMGKKYFPVDEIRIIDYDEQNKCLQVFAGYKASPSTECHWMHVDDWDSLWAIARELFQEGTWWQQ